MNRLLSVEVRRAGDQWVVLASYFGLERRLEKRALSYQDALKKAAEFSEELELGC